MITGEQASLARRLLGWSLMRLSNFCGVSDVTIQNFEIGRDRRPTRQTSKRSNAPLRKPV
jgi:transcriptional regulator with XRE-family HTH domain